MLCNLSTPVRYVNRCHMSCVCKGKTVTVYKRLVFKKYKLSFGGLSVCQEPLLHLKPRDNQKHICITECLLEFTKINIIQCCVCAFVCVFACLSLGAQVCVFTCAFKWDSQCVVAPDKSPRLTVLLHSLSLSRSHTHTYAHTVTCMRALTNVLKHTHTHTHSTAIVDSLIFPALLFLIHLLNLPPPTHMHAPTHTHTHKLVNTHSISKQLKQLKT